MLASVVAVFLVLASYNSVYSLRIRFPHSHRALELGKWVKFIAGASNQDLPHIRNMCYLYTRATVDCIDVSADLAVVDAALDGVRAAIRDERALQRPVIMVSVNDGNDLHFRKASFDPNYCPPLCPRPCERVCPALAIPANPIGEEGVLQDKCYGCGRCIAVCPENLITDVPYTVSAQHIKRLMAHPDVNGVEIHTSLCDLSMFSRLWNEVGETVLSNAIDVLAVSFPSIGEETVGRVQTVQGIISSSPSFKIFDGVQIWQCDGRPMSGDIGKGTVHPSINLANMVLERSSLLDSTSGLDFRSGRQFVQVAGGANRHSASVAHRTGLATMTGFGGFGFGGEARKTLVDLFKNVDRLAGHSSWHIEDHPELLESSLSFAKFLVASVKNVTSHSTQ